MPIGWIRLSIHVLDRSGPDKGDSWLPLNLKELAPDWIATERYDIIAKASGDPPRTMMFQMVKSLLADRFGLVLRNETRERPIYDLVRMNADTLGPRLRRSTVDCKAIVEAAQHGVAPPKSDRMLCGSRLGSGMIQSGGLPMATIACVMWAGW